MTVQMPNLALIETKRISVCIANIDNIKHLKRKHGDIATNTRHWSVKELKHLLK